MKHLIWGAVLLLMSGVSLADQADDTAYEFKTKRVELSLSCAYDIEHRVFMNSLRANGYEVVSAGVGIKGLFFNQVVYNEATKRIIVLSTDQDGVVCMLANYTELQ